MENQIFQLQYALDTFYFLICGALVMWMAAGFAMLEAGLVRSKNTTEILTKNISLYAVACTMYMVCGYSIMYGGGDFSLFLSGIIGDGVAGAEEPATYAPSADFYFQVVFVATAMSIVSGAVTHETVGVPCLRHRHDRPDLPDGRSLDLGRGTRLRYVHPG